MMDENFDFFSLKIYINHINFYVFPQTIMVFRKNYFSHIKKYAVLYSRLRSLQLIYGTLTVVQTVVPDCTRTVVKLSKMNDFIELTVYLAWLSGV